MKAIILAAGDDANSSLKTLCQDKPRCLLPVESSSLIEIQIDTLHFCGIEDISVVRGYKSETIQIPGLKYYENTDYKTTHILQSLFCARDEMNDDCLVLYADVLFDEQVIRRIMESRHDVAIGVMINYREAFKQRKELALEDLEMVYFDSENRVTKIGKFPEDKDVKNKGHFNGIAKFSKHGIEILKRRRLVGSRPVETS